MKSLGPQPPPPPGAEVSKGAPPVVGAKVKAAPSAETRAASRPDDICKRDEERLEQLHAHPSRDEAMRFADELRCETLRPQLLAVIETSGSSGPPPAASDASKDASPDAKTTVGTLPAAPPRQAKFEATPDEYCKLDEERLERMQAGASMREAARFADELRCERLRPQILGLMERLSSLAPGSAPAAAEASKGEPTEAKGSLQAPAGLPTASAAAPSASEENCKRDEERLERLRSHPSRDEAARFADDMRCERVRPQLLALMETFGSSAPAQTATAASNAAPDAEAQGRSPRRPLRLLRRASAAPSTRTKSANATRTPRAAAQQSLERRGRPLRRRIELRGLAASALAPDGEPGLCAGLGVERRLVRGLSALSVSSGCAADQDRLVRIRAEPSADAAQQLWRELQCERLRPQVRLLLASLNVAAGPTAACQKRRPSSAAFAQIPTEARRRASRGRSPARP